VHRSCVLCALTLLTACSDRLTAPEAEAVLNALEQPLRRGEPRERLWTRLGWEDLLAKLKTASQVTVSQDGHRLKYSAVVFERLMVPPTGSGRSPCLGPRWALLLWGQGEHPQGISISGGRFDQPFSLGRYCQEVNFMDATPRASWYPGEVGNGWATGSGRGDIQSGLDDGACMFLTAADAELLHRNMGVTCRMTRHWVHFDASLHPVLGGTCGGGSTPCLGPGTMRIQLRPVEVMGIRYTLDCALPQAENMCGKWWR
jgi:hypothetical protein